MEQIYFKQLVGSRFFSTNKEKSDTDYFIIWNGITKNTPGQPHYMYHSPTDGIDKILGITCNFYQILDGFGENLEGKNLFSEYIQQNIEEIKSKNIGISYNYFNDLVVQTPFNEGVYKRNPKRTGHILLYQKIFIDYANGLPLRAALQIGEFAQFLQAARERKISYNEISKEENILRQQFNQLKNFYNNKIDKEFAYKEKEKMKQIINNIIVEQQYQEDK